MAVFSFAGKFDTSIVRHEFTGYELESYRSLEPGWLEYVTDVDPNGFSACELDAEPILAEIERRVVWSEVFDGDDPSEVVRDHALANADERTLQTFVCEQMTRVWRSSGNGGRKPAHWDDQVWQLVQTLRSAQ